MSVYRKVCMSITGKSTYVESEDSDYEPPEQIKISTKRKREREPADFHGSKRKRRKPISKQDSVLPYNLSNRSNREEVREKSTHSRHYQTTGGTVRKLPVPVFGKVSDDDNSSPWEILPAEILSKVFGYVVAMEGSALPCLKTLRGVCKNWSAVANIPHLWTHMSFSPKLIPNERKFKTEHKTKDICLSHKFHYTHTYHFARLKMIASRIMKVASDRSEQIKELHVENCALGDALNSIVKRHGRNLRKFSIINLCNLTQATLRKCQSELGENLKSMEVTCLNQQRLLCGRSLNHLKNLTELKLQYMRNFDIHDIEDLTMLQVLHLKDTRIELSNVHEFNHPKLEDVDLSSETRISMGNDELVEMLHNCSELRRLSLRGRYVSIDALCLNLRLCNHIVHLDVSVVDSGKGDNSIGSLLHSIGPSLRELHIDKYINLEESFKLGDQYRSAWKQLRIVSMQSTNIQGHTLLSYLTDDSFCETQILNVSICRELPRGCKRNWSDIKSLRVLLKKLLGK